MDDDLQQLEAELKRLRPAEPSPELFSKIGRQIETAAPRRRLAPVHWIGLAALPAAAAMALLVVHFAPRRAEPDDSRGAASSTRITGGQSLTPIAASDAPMKPVAAENVLVSASDEGLVTLDDGTPARRERLQYVDTITWKNPRTNASLTWRVPREEVRVIPVSFQ